MAPLFVQRIAPLQQFAVPVPPPRSGPTWADIQQSNRDFIGDRGARSVSEASTLSGTENYSDLSNLVELLDSENEESTVDIVGQLFGADSDSELSSDLDSDTDEDDRVATVYGKQGARLSNIVHDSTEDFRSNTEYKLIDGLLDCNPRLAEVLYEEAEDFYSKVRKGILDSISRIENRRKYDLRQRLLEFVESHKQLTTKLIEDRISNDLKRRAISSSGASVNADDTEKLQLVGIEVVKEQNGIPLDERPAEVAEAEPDQFLHQGSGQDDHDNNLETSEEVRAKKKHRVWNHLTISRDQTAASDFAKELLSILRSSKFHHAVNESEHRHDEPSVDHFVSFTPLSHRLIAHKHQDQDPIGVLQQPETESFRAGQLQNLQLHQNLLEQQRLRLRLMRQRGPCQTHTNSEHRLNSPTLSIYPHIGMDLSNNATHSETQTSSNLPRHSDPVSNAIPDVSGNNDNLKYLIDRITSLEAENNGFKEAQKEVARSETLYFIQVDHKRNYTTYLDEPMWTVGPRGEVVLKAHFPIHDISGYLSQKHDVAFAILKFYDWGQQGELAQKAFQDKKALPRPQPSAETIRLQSHSMIEAAEEFFAQQPKFFEEFPGFNIRGSIEAPYLFWYHYRSIGTFNSLRPTHQGMMKFLTSWIEENYGSLYSKVEDQLKRGVISAETMNFLIQPGDVLLWKEKRDTMAVIAQSWPTSKNPPPPKSVDKKTDWRKSSNITDNAPTWKWEVNSWQYDYDGSFFRKKFNMEILMQSEVFEEEIAITKLSTYPLRYASKEIKTALETRGKTFWSCRFRRLVSYKDDRSMYGTGERFMIDFHTYEQLHSDSHSFKRSYPSLDDPNCERINPTAMASDEPPSVPEIYVFPKTTVAYNLRSKKWVDLEVDLIQDVTWNKKSFEHLVVDLETKDLVQALVTNQIEREQSTDIIDGKGNGLIILLHGGPGTGKTFTAESVAEMAEKPLFRVTCGDIGTKPEDVEKYLESVLHLGKNWGCVVLLDEADVFLEQRTLTDLERNALVSVFLRVLEYYEGILILTSNRVGTFDEAFKSRIQLSLHYENLTRGQRSKIWRNFLNRLKDLDGGSASNLQRTNSGLRHQKPVDPTGIDFEDVECYLSDLAEFEMNGRQIRNAITTARQLAKFKGERMSYHHLKHVISVSSKFDTYLKTLQEGFSDDQVARGDGIR